MTFYTVKTFNELQKNESLRIEEEIKNIFFEASSKKDFRDEEHKEEFFTRWCGNYLRYYPESFFLYLDQDNQTVGYLSAVFDTMSSLAKFDYPGERVFLDHYKRFPAHLHINFSEKVRGLGLGSQLVLHVIDNLKTQKISGLNLITTPDALNVKFYERLGFDFTEVKNHNGHDLLFMGIDL